MSGGVYGGDEVGALVVDPGHYSFRIGFAGEEFPKADLPSIIGVSERGALEQVKDEAMDENRPPSASSNNKSGATGGGNAAGTAAVGAKRYMIDPCSIRVPQTSMEVQPMLKDGMIEDWEMFEAMMDYAYSRHLGCDTSTQPVLVSEPPGNTRAKREKLTELMFEKYRIPAFYLTKNAVLAAFANGRSSGLVLDSGATHTTAVPIRDGYCLNQGVVKSPMGGDLLVNQCEYALSELGVELVPSYLIKSKEAVDEEEPPVYVKRPNTPEVTKSYHNYMVKEILDDFKCSVLQLSDTPLETSENMHGYKYEFPCGYNKEFTDERVKIPEGLFDTSYLKNVNPQTLMTVSQVAASSVGMCDISIKPQLYGNLIVTGGNSLLQGFVERLNYDLQSKCPSSAKLKIIAAPTPAERRFGSWIGGSILASLGSFQQMWISKQEYDETGKSMIDKKCP